MTALTKAAGVEKFIPLGTSMKPALLIAIDTDELVEVDGVAKRLKLLAVPDNRDDVKEAMESVWLEWA
eukprot:8592554-Alexandrium_andersonii.AAC.1